MGHGMGHRMGHRMGHIRALMGHRMVCEVAFQRVCLEEAALGGRAGLRVGPGFGPGRMGRASGRVGVALFGVREPSLFGVREPCLICVQSIFVLSESQTPELEYKTASIRQHRRSVWGKRTVSVWGKRTVSNLYPVSAKKTPI